MSDRRLSCNGITLFILGRGKHCYTSMRPSINVHVFVELADSFVTLGCCFFSRSFQGQLIWAKFAFDALSSKDGLWTPAEMEAALPSGKDGVYRHVMTVLQVRASFIFLGQLMHASEPMPTAGPLAACMSSSPTFSESNLNTLSV